MRHSERPPGRARCLRAIAWTAALALTLLVTVARAQLAYAPPGQLQQAGGRGRVDPMVYAPEIRFPLEAAPAYLNSQVYGAGGLHGGGGHQCDTVNYSYPWHDNYCEQRHWSMPLCPAGHGHQGQDIRPATCERDRHWAVAVSDGRITHVGSYSVYLTDSEGRRFDYLHMSNVLVSPGQRVTRGERLGMVSNVFPGSSTSIHLHFNIRMPVSGYGSVYVPPYLSLVRAYESLLRVPSTAGPLLFPPLESGATVVEHVARASDSNFRTGDCRPVSAPSNATVYTAPVGAAVRSAAVGRVIRSVDGCPEDGGVTRCGSGYGNHVIVLHDGGRATLYGGLARGSGLPPLDGRVGCGERLGTVGRSGPSFADGLMFEVRDGVTSADAFASRPASDPFGGACATPREPLWAASPLACTAVEPHDDSTFVDAAHRHRVNVAPGVEIRQRWTLLNSGTTSWATGYALVRVGGPSLMGLERIGVDGPGTAPGERRTFELVVRAPDRGTARVDYRLHNTEGEPFGAVVSLTLQVPDDGPCYSETLGSSVPPGTCVQVDRPACGETRCGWYRCSTSAWSSTLSATASSASVARTRPTKASKSSPGSRSSQRP